MMPRLPLICAALLGGALAITACAPPDEQEPVAGEGTAALSTERTSPDPVFSKQVMAGKKAEAAREAARGKPGDMPRGERVIRRRDRDDGFIGATDEPVEGAEQARAPAQSGDTDCEARCGPDRLCRMLCDAGADGVRVELAHGDCVLCGRETGFRGGAELRVELDDGVALLRWSPVAEADDYFVTGLRWARDAHPTDASYAWVVAGLSLAVPLERGFVYRFQVTPRTDGELNPALASKPVFIER